MSIEIFYFILFFFFIVGVRVEIQLDVYRVCFTPVSCLGLSMLCAFPSSTSALEARARAAALASVHAAQLHDRDAAISAIDADAAATTSRARALEDEIARLQAQLADERRREAELSAQKRDAETQRAAHVLAQV